MGIQPIANLRSVFGRKSTALSCPVPEMADRSDFGPVKDQAALEDRVLNVLSKGKHVLVFEQFGKLVNRLMSRVKLPLQLIDQNTVMAKNEGLVDILNGKGLPSLICIFPRVMGFVLPIPKVGLVIDTLSEVRCIDPDTKLPVVNTEFADIQEVLFRQAWASESADTELLCLYKKTDLLFSGSKAMDRTMKLDMNMDLFTHNIMRRTKNAELQLNLSTLPFSTMDSLVVLEYLRRAQLFKTIEKSALNAYTSGQYFRSTSKLLAAAQFLHEHYKMALFIARMISGPERLLRIAIRLAIVGSFADRSMYIGPTVSRFELKIFAKGAGKHLTSRGYLWTVLGLWEFGFRHRELVGYTKGSGVFPIFDGRVGLHIPRCQNALSQILGIEQGLGLKNLDMQEWISLSDQELSAKEVDIIEENLLLTGMFEMVFCPKGQPAFSPSSVSGSTLHFRADDLASPDMSRDYPELERAGTGSRVGLALRFEKEQDLTFARCVTFVQATMLDKIEEKTGIRAQDVLRSSY